MSWRPGSAPSVPAAVQVLGGQCANRRGAVLLTQGGRVLTGGPSVRQVTTCRQVGRGMSRGRGGGAGQRLVGGICGRSVSVEGTGGAKSLKEERGTAGRPGQLDGARSGRSRAPGHQAGGRQGVGDSSFSRGSRDGSDL